MRERPNQPLIYNLLGFDLFALMKSTITYFLQVLMLMVSISVIILVL